MKYRVLSKDLFPDYKIPARPTKEDKYIQQIFNAENISVRISPEKVQKIMRHYLRQKSNLALYYVGNSIVNKPAKRTLWLLASKNIQGLLKKIQPYVEDYAGSIVFEYEKETLQINVGRIAASSQAVKYCLFCYLSILHHTLIDDYTLEIQLTSETADTEDVIQNFYNTVIKHNCAETKIIVRGNNIIGRALNSSNPVIEDLLTPGFEKAILPEDDEIISMAKQLINENMNNQNFDLAELAQMLCVSKRTIQRKLKSSGTTFMQLKNDERTKFITNRLIKGNTGEALSFMAKNKGEKQKILMKQK